MNLTRLSEARYVPAYGILCAEASKLHAHDGLRPTFGRIPAGGATTPHQHFEPELFFIVRGQARMTVQGQTREVGEGDLVRVPPFATHQLHNVGTQELEFLSVYSEDFEVAQVPARAIVTAAPPTPNGPLHLGHLSGPYLAADILARHLRRAGSQVWTHCGSDDHQTYVAERARALGEDPETFRQRMRTRIRQGFEAFEIAFDELVEPRTDRAYQAKVQRFAARAIEAGVIRRETVQLPCCPRCRVALVDAVVDGRCPACAQPSRGGCESCGLVVPPDELLDPRCARCHTPAVRRDAQVYVFPLSDHLPKLDLELPLPPRLRDLVDRARAGRGLKVWVSHPTVGEQGLPLPGTDQVLHVWFEMAAHYETFATSGQPWVHCFGFDNAFHYLLFIPALLRAMSPDARLPLAVVTNEFLLLDGEKFSTSRGHALWADEVKGNLDHLRLYLCLQRPSLETSNFSWEAFHRFSEDLEEQLRALASDFQGRWVPGGSQLAALDRHRFARDMERLLSPSTFDLRRASRRLLAFLDEVRQLRCAPSEAREAYATLLEFLAPFMPREAQRLAAALPGVDP